jgi:excisionase family DNA binding protein
MEHYNLRAELSVRRPSPRTTEELFDRIVDDLAEFSAAASISERGRVEVVITIPGDTLRQAVQVGLAVLTGAGLEPVRVEAMTTAEWDASNGVTDRVPELLSVTDVATMLGLTRQGVLHRINTGDLPAKKVGREYAIPADAVKAVSR